MHELSNRYWVSINCFFCLCGFGRRQNDQINKQNHKAARRAFSIGAVFTKPKKWRRSMTPNPITATLPQWNPRPVSFSVINLRGEGKCLAKIEYQAGYSAWALQQRNADCQNLGAGKTDSEAQKNGVCINPADTWGTLVTVLSACMGCACIECARWA